MWYHVLLFHIIHFFYNLYTSLFLVCQAIVDWFGPPIIVTPDLLLEDLQCLDKIPEHLAVVVQEDQENTLDFDEVVEDIAQFACYCSTAGIRCLSLYDAQGILKMRVGQLYKEISFAQRLWLHDRNATDMVHITSKAGSPLYAAKDWNITSALQLNVLSEEDGRPLIADVTKRLCADVAAGRLLSDQIDVGLVDRHLTARPFTEPQLMILFGRNPRNHVTLDGFPPWHIRLTEMFNGSRHERLDYTLFRDSLYKFSKVQQRFGR